MDSQFITGMAVGQKHFARIQAKGSRWQNRNIPAYIRQHLMVPYYYTHEETTQVLWVIQSPVEESEKVHFVRFATDSLHEKQETGSLPDHPK